MPKLRAKMAAKTRVRAVMLGDSGCGKTCLLFAFMKRSFPTGLSFGPIEAIEDFTVHGEEFELKLCDTNGSEEFHRFLAFHFHEPTDVILICYPVDSSDALERVPRKMTPELEKLCGNIPKILVGTKSDLRSNANSNEPALVSPEEGRAMAKQIKAYAYLECSAMSREGLQEVFEAAVRAGLKNAKQKLKVNLKINKCILL